MANRDTCVDVIVDTPEGIVLVKRRNEPYKDRWALPGGGWGIGETKQDAARRELHEETGIEAILGSLYFMGSYDDAGRDPRGPSITFVYVTRMSSVEPKAGSDAADARFFKMHEIYEMDLAFDHKEILYDYEGWRLVYGTDQI